MATKLESFEFRAGGYAKWNWDELLDGSIWKLKKGVDFDRDVKKVAAALRSGAALKGKGLSVSVLNSTTLVIQARTKVSRLAKS